MEMPLILLAHHVEFGKEIHSPHMFLSFVLSVYLNLLMQQWTMDIGNPLSWLGMDPSYPTFILLMT